MPVFGKVVKVAQKYRYHYQAGDDADENAD